MAIPVDKTIWEWLTEHTFDRRTKRTTSGYTDVDTQQRVTYLQLKDYATYLSTALGAVYGTCLGDAVAIFSPNTVWYPVAMFAALRLGATVSGVSPTYTKDELSYALRKTKTKILWTTYELKSVAVAAVQDLSHDCSIILLEPQPNSIETGNTLETLANLGKSYGEEKQIGAYKVPPGQTNKDICAFLNLSSGTTGLPKAVIISHQNVIAQCLQVEQITSTDHRRVLGALPVYHIQGLIHILHVPVALNAEVYLMRKFSMEGMLEAVAKYEIRELCLVPPIIILLAKSPLVEKYDLSCIRRFFSGAAPLSDGVLKVLQERFPQTGFKQGYGLTESCSAITLHPPDMLGYENAGFGGTLVANTEISIRSIDDGRELGVDETGEILARGPQITEGYLGDPNATASTFDSEGWLHTGDIGRMNNQGFLIVSDRIKDLIKVKGVGVAPAELEDLLLTHSQVESCAVLGAPDAYAGETPVAYVVLRNAGTAPADKTTVGMDLLQLVRRKRAPHKWLSKLEIVESIPKSPTGKILKKVIRDDPSRMGTSIVVSGKDATKIGAKVISAKL
ncbi:4-coumarate-coa ligase/4-coumaroyl-CoA synthase [Exophiala viscosa]|uniref:4-coumarate-coa ligase/4-coumaroyl-CoA synthase n=1 Tax=Exophiala viscosa TaxID=2486360 RepID=UPI00219AF6DA|nr:4-coumarate-coa ligase/4-coumaroyl-CoA synthase [Exophiala viscosa]